MKRFKEQCPQKVSAYIAEISNLATDKIVYVDETGIDTFIHREYAYAKKGKTVIGRISGKKYQRVGIVAAQIAKNIISPLQYDGAMDSSLFEYWFEYLLIPLLPSSSTVVMDNASFHRKSRLIPLAQKSGHNIIFLPPYSPELNPIENFWAWIKARLKKLLPTHSIFDEALSYCFS